jgi:short-subunit dehydrogenase
MKNRLRNHVVVITGASSGFGRGAAEKFAREGAHVVLAARRGDALDTVARECRRRGVQALAVETDVSNESQVESLAQAALREFGRFDVWVNNAGVATYGRFTDSPMEEHEQVIRTNLLGAMYGSRAALKQFRRQGKGVLINVSSFAGIASFPYGASYTASKHGLRGLDTALRQELLVHGNNQKIHVCTVMPTSMDTPFFQHAANHTGRPVQPMPPVYNPELVVDKIVELAVRPKPEVVVGRRGKVGKAAARLTPRAMEKQMATRAHKAMMERNEWAPDSSGNLFAPVEYGTEVHGGWKKSSALGNVIRAGLGLGLSAGLIYLFRAPRGEPRQEEKIPAA